MFERTWNSVTMDFIVKLFKSRNPVSNTNYNNILVIIDRLTKYGKFMSANESHSIEDLADIIVRKVISNHRLPNEFVTDRGTTFVFRFFIAFTAKFGINSKLSIVFYL